MKVVNDMCKPYVKHPTMRCVFKKNIPRYSPLIQIKVRYRSLPSQMSQYGLSSVLLPWY